MLGQGDLKLLALALIAEQPPHGYELIKLIEEKTSDCYSPSPGVVYPTLTLLEEAGYVTAESEGAKRRYTITEEGRAYLEENRDIADMILARLAAIGTRVARMRRRFRRDEEEDEKASVPQLVGAALDNLRSVTAKRLEGQNGEAETRIVEILARAAQDLRSASARLASPKGAWPITRLLGVRRKGGLNSARSWRCMVAMALAESREVRGREPGAAERLRERLPSYAAALVLTLLFMGATLPSPLYVIYRHELHFSQVTLTLIYAVYFAGAMATAFFLGRISDEIGRRVAILAAVFISIVASLVFIFADALNMLFIGRLLSGLALPLASGAGTAWIVELCEDRCTAASLSAGAILSGLGLGALISGLLANIRRSRWSFPSSRSFRSRSPPRSSSGSCPRR